MSIRIRTSDSAEMLVDAQIAMLSETINNMNHFTTPKPGDDDALIPISHSIMEKIAEWANQHKNDPEVLAGAANENPISAWDQQFLDREREDKKLFDLILAANYLDISLLLDTCCKYTAVLVKGKSVEEIRRIFKIEKPEGYKAPDEASADTLNEASTEASAEASAETSTQASAEASPKALAEASPKASIEALAEASAKVLSMETEEEKKEKENKLDLAAIDRPKCLVESA